MLTLKYEEENLTTAYLHLKSQFIKKISTLNPFSINLNTIDNSAREDVVKFIQNVYKKSFNADINVDYPVLMSVHDENNTILAAVGIRYAAHTPLFLERYTQAPIELFLSTERNQIVEIGNLASAGHGASVFIFNALCAYLNDQHIQFAAVTGTSFLHRYFDRLGLQPREICPASGMLNPLELKHWGDYYETNPRVLVGSIKHSAEKLQVLFGAQFERTNAIKALVHQPI